MTDHTNVEGYCSQDRQLWPCAAVPVSTPGYVDACRFAYSQRAGTDYPDTLPHGVQTHSAPQVAFS